MSSVKNMVSLLIGLWTLVTVSSDTTTFTIEVSAAGSTIVDEFLSVTIDAGLSEHWSAFDFHNTRANTLAKGLGPAYLRYGGSHGDGTVYDTSGNITGIESESVLNMSQFSELADFAQDNNMKLVFALNEFGERTKDNTWDSTNAKDLMIKIIESDRKNLVFAFELGNEPALKQGKSNAVSSTQLAKDFNTLYGVIQDVWNNPKDGIITPKIWGPDSCCGNWNYMQDFLKTSKPYGHLNGVTWHQYDCSGGSYTLSQFTDIKYMDALIPLINNTFSWIDKDYIDGTANIMGETGPANHGGQANLTDSYVAGFFWLDKLGVASIMGIHAVCRQDFWGTNYELITNKYEPTPDYWSGYLFKHLVGNKVLSVDGQLKSGRHLRTYSFCTRTANNGSVYNYTQGSITIMILNLHNSTQTMDFDFNGGNVDISDGFDEFVLTSYPRVINSADVFLNGKVMKMNSDDSLPSLEPVNSKDKSVTLQALSYGFFVIPNAKAPACM